jgi:hypothetical protein
VPEAICLLSRTGRGRALEARYNAKRLHSAVRYSSPIEFQRQLLAGIADRREHELFRHGEISLKILILCLDGFLPSGGSHDRLLDDTVAQPLQPSQEVPL